MIDPLPKYHQFMLPTLKALEALGGSGSIDEIQDHVIAATDLNPGQLELTYQTSGAAIAVDRMSWARSWMKHGGFVESGGRAVWVLTDLGREALTWTPEAIRKRCHEQYKLKQVAKEKSGGIVNDESQDLETDWKDELLTILKNILPDAFERLCQRVLRESGFVKVEVTGKSGDGGIDGTGVLRMNLISFQVLFQCKRYAGSVSSGTVRDFRGAMQGRADKGLVITTGTFTPDARREATRDGAPAIDLIDGEALCLLLKDLHLGVSVKQVMTEQVSVDSAFLQSI